MSSQVPRSRSKYQRPRRQLSWTALVFGALLGIAGGLYYAWVIDNRIEYDTEPWQLNPDDRAAYITGIALAYAYDGDLSRAVQRLIEMRPQGDPIQEVADVACRLATSGFVDSSSGLRAIRSLMLFYQLQGRSGCADTLIQVSERQPTAVLQIELPTPTAVPPPSKTPPPENPVVPTPTLPRLAAPTAVVNQDYQIVSIQTLCDTDIVGLIEVFVQNFEGQGVPGQAVRVRWDGGEDRFFTGLKPERGPGYADFRMAPDTGYIIDMPGRSAPSSQPLSATACVTDTGRDSLRSYRVFFRPTG